jgi:hypothetical protein
VTFMFDRNSQGVSGEDWFQSIRDHALLCSIQSSPTMKMKETNYKAEFIFTMNGYGTDKHVENMREQCERILRTRLKQDINVRVHYMLPGTNGVKSNGQHSGDV